VSRPLNLSKDVAQASVGEIDNVAVRINQNDYSFGRVALVAREPSIRFLGDLVFLLARLENSGFLPAGRYRNACSVGKLNLTNWRRMINLGRGSDTP
jgi:hypothetical protein